LASSRASRHRSALVVDRVDVGEGSLGSKIGFGRAWRDSARSGAIYRELKVDTPRSRDRQRF
jgi:hypothetical protein